MLRTPSTDRPRRIGNVTLRSTNLQPERAPVASLVSDIQSSVLQKCPLWNQILQTPCRVTLDDRRYGILSSTLYFQGGVGRETISAIPLEHRQYQVTYSILHNVLTQVAREQNICVQGSIHVYVVERIHSVLDNNNNNNNRYNQRRVQRRQYPVEHVVPSASSIDLGSLSDSCIHSKLIYVPVTITWLHSDSDPIPCYACPSHATALIIDPSLKTIELIDSNGTAPTYYGVVAAWIGSEITKNPQFIGYQFLSDTTTAPHWGFQTNTELEMCSYFSALYVCLRMYCPSISSQQLYDALVQIPRRQMYDLLSQFHCFLLDYAYDHNILQAASQLVNSMKSVYGILINARYHSISPERAARYWQYFNVALELASSDVRKAVSYLKQITRRLRNVNS
ncbi:MAG: hypothetical protein Sylvanvirus19_11 [Sylvanvirus sp.]|uniref:Uncharacterized protein n=1 Tax=Sylvanvirus sp. TaxID=2487774 RepID=A0A3G5AIQ3_9VIRU|nr:MAG: hypothetical protein Sylvanvirus19_11 [Sylvanvirus sp.]